MRKIFISRHYTGIMIASKVIVTQRHSFDLSVHFRKGGARSNLEAGITFLVSHAGGRDPTM